MLVYESTLSIRLEAECQIALYGGPVLRRVEAESPRAGTDRLLRAWRRRASDHEKQPLGPEEARDFGKELAGWLLPLGVAEALGRARRFCAERDARLRLRFLGERNVPLEILEFEGEPLGLDPIVRPYRPVEASSARRRDSNRPLRILVASANPATGDYPRLGWIEEELLAIIAATNGFAEFHFLGNAAPAQIQREIRRIQPQIFHFSGHGEARKTGSSLVTLGLGEGDVGHLEGEQLGRWLSEAGTRLAVLMACNSASMAQELVESGVEAAVGAQLPLRSSAPLPLSAALYGALGRGHGFEEVVAIAREAARDLNGDWIAPVLYTDGVPGRIVAPPDPTPDIPALTNLPPRERPLVGRERERADLRRALMDEGRRLVHLQGVGGIGKSRLASAVGHDLLPGFPEGVWRVFVPEKATPESLLTELRSVPALNGAAQSPCFLVILDGCERTAEAEIEAALQEFLDTIPGATVLSTGRRPVRLPDSLKIDLGPLDIDPEEGSPSLATKLFLQTASEAIRDFQVTADERRTVETICRRLAGHPLALVLAASRMRHVPGVLDLAEILEEDLAALGDEGQSLKSVVESSLQDLREEDRQLLARLCVFEGEFGLADPLGVYDMSRNIGYGGMARLQDHSLVERTTREGRTRYRILDPIRQTVGETLGIGAADRRAHAVHYASLARSKVEMGDLDNLRAALAYSVAASDRELLISLADSLARTLFEAGYWADLDRLFDVAFGIGVPDFESRMLGIQGALRARRNDDAGSLADWQRRAERCAELGDRVGRADALPDIACRGFWTDPPEVVEPRLTEAIEAAREAARPELVASGYVLRGLLGERGGDPIAARRWAEEANAVARPEEGSDPWLFVDTNLGRLLLFGGDPAGSKACYGRALRDALRRSRRHHLAGALDGFAAVYESAGRSFKAVRCAHAAASLYTQLGSSWRERPEIRLARLRQTEPAQYGLAKAVPGGWASVADEILRDELLD